MTFPRTITIDRCARRDEGAYGLIIEAAGQAPILLELEGCDSSFNDVMGRLAKMTHTRWCVVRLVPVDGNELLLLDFERLQSFKRNPEE